MTSAAARIAERAAEMRREFDRAFAAPARFDQVLQDNFLAIKVAGRPCAIALSEIAGLHVDKKITPVPGGNAALRGIAGFRGIIVPVYDLSGALGFSRSSSPRWLVISKAASVALAFESFDRQLRVLPDDVVPQAGPGMRGCSRTFLRTQSFSGPIIHLPSVLDVLKTSRPSTQ
jgi:purine-binding chemotaxis protein CheW